MLLEGTPVSFKPHAGQNSESFSWQPNGSLNCETGEENRQVLANVGIRLQVSLLFCFQNFASTPLAALRAPAIVAGAALPCSGVAPCIQMKLSLLSDTM